MSEIFEIYVFFSGVVMREKKNGLSRVQRFKKRLSHSFGRLGKFFRKRSRLFKLIKLQVFTLCEILENIPK